MGLLDGVKGMMTNVVVDKVSDVLGIENGMMKSAIKMFLPAVIGGVISKGSTPSGAGGLLDLFKSGGYGDDNIGDLMGVMGDADKSSGWMDTGADLLGSIFGNSQSGVLDLLISKTGMGKGVGGMLLKFIAPLVINKLAGVVSGKNMNAAGLSSYLNDQKSDVMGLVPGLGNLLGGDATVNQSSDDNKGGMGFIKWLLPLAIAGIAFWYFTQNKGTEVDTAEPAKFETGKTETSTIENKAAPSKRTHTVEVKGGENTNVNTTIASTDYSGYDINDNLDIVSASGAVVYSYGSFDLDKNNNIVDGDGKILIASTSLPDTFISKLTKMLMTLKK